MSFPPKIDVEWESFKRLSMVFIVGLVILLIFARIYQPLLVSLVLSAIVAYIFDPLISVMVEYLNLRRKVLVGFLIGIVVFCVSVTAFFIFPVIYDELIDIVTKLPDALAYIEKSTAPFVIWIKKSKIISEQTIENSFRRLDLLENLIPSKASLVDLFSQSSLIIDIIFNVLMFPLFTYALLGEKDRVIEGFTKWIPRDVAPLMGLFAGKVDKVLRAVVKGQFLVALVLCVFYMLGFSLVGVPSGLAIGAIAGICRVVPYLDVLVSIVLCSIVILSSGLGGAMFVAVLGVVAVVQSIDGVIVTPRIIGDRAGLHPIIVIASVYCFGTLLGVLGVLLAVPIVAAFVVAAQTCWPYVMHAPFYQTEASSREVLVEEDSDQAKLSKQN